MSSIYDEIKTPEELVRMVKIQGLSTKEDDVIRAQDIFGHACEDELIRLAHDNGRVDERGNPDPEGNWTTGRDGLSDTFYFVLFTIWNWQDAVRFYNAHSNFAFVHLQKELDSTQASLHVSDHAVEKAYTKISELEAELHAEKEQADHFELEAIRATNALEKAQQDMIELKARLFDYMVKEEG